MFACLNVWMTESFEKNVVEEFKDFLKRVRHHASLGLLCGNNEMEDCFRSKDYTLRNNEKTRFDYIKLYETVLPDVCEKYAPDIFYWPSSPSSGGGFNNPQDENNGDVHYWGAWHGNIPFESYRQYYFRFCSEFGFEAFPDMKTIRSFTEPSDLNPFSYIMSSHQKSPNGNTKILSYSSDKYLYPTSFEGFVYASQILQADAIRYGVEHFRRFRGRCMGAIYWQLNDCWPVASWASIDYFGRWKALHYASKRFFAPTLLSAHEDGTSVTLNISNEQLAGFTGNVKYSICENDLSVVYERVVAVSVGAMSSKDIITEDFAQYIKGNEKNRFLSYSLYDSDDNLVSNSSLLFTKPKFFHLCKPETEVSVEGAEGEFKISVKSKQYIKGLQISFDDADAILSDNFFDITSEQPIVIKAVFEDKSLTAVQLMSQISLLSVYDIGK
jgi:beta-mannosidase